METVHLTIATIKPYFPMLGLISRFQSRIRRWSEIQTRLSKFKRSAKTSLHSFPPQLRERSNVMLKVSRGYGLDFCGIRGDPQGLHQQRWETPEKDNNQSECCDESFSRQGRFESHTGITRKNVGLLEHLKIVVKGHRARANRDDYQPQVLDCAVGISQNRSDQVKLSAKSCQGRNPCPGKHQNHQAQRQDRFSFGEPGEISDLNLSLLCFHQPGDCKKANDRQPVSDGVKDQRFECRGRVSDQAKQSVSSMRNRAVGKQTSKIGLRDGQQIPKDHTE